LLGDGVTVVALVGQQVLGICPQSMCQLARNPLGYLL
jgi:hypothetical protein